MIKVFRKIRQHMLTENKFSKYFLYAIGEIVLVMIGILLALQVNNWNEDRKQIISEKKFISGIKKDLKQDQSYMNLIINIGEIKVEVFNILNNELSELYANDKSKLDSLLQMFFIDNRTFYPISGTFQSAISGNEINKFKNKKVISELVKLYNSEYKRLIDNGNILDERFEFILKKYTQTRRKGHFRDMTLTETSELLDDLFYYFKQLDYYIKILNDVHVDIDTILK